MKHSTDRILTTHVGSLPRPADLLALLAAKESGEEHDADLLAAMVKEAVTDVVQKQAEVGIDVVSDGEMSKNSFTNYVTDRLAGLERQNTGGYAAMVGTAGSGRDAVGAGAGAGQRELGVGGAAPSLGPRTPDGGAPALGVSLPVNNAELTWKNRAYEQDIINLTEALRGVNVTEAFMPAVAVGQVLFMIPTTHYSSEDDYLRALADTLRDEYRAIADAGLILQIDSPDLVMMRHRQYLNASWDEYRASIERRVEALNEALKDVPEEQTRFHICWGNFPGPHDVDIPLKDVIDLLLKVKAQAYLVEAANPRHAHEWEVWQTVKLPDDKIVIPGVVDTKSSYVEHPELIAQRIVQYANIVGRERVMAAPDCGFGTFAGWAMPGEASMWAKFKSMVEGADIATSKLW